MNFGALHVVKKDIRRKLVTLTINQQKQQIHTEYKHKNIVTYVSVWLIIMYNIVHTIWKTLSGAISAKTPSECHFNAQNQASVQTIYYTEATNQANIYARRDDYYGRGLGQGGRG